MLCEERSFCSSGEMDLDRPVLVVDLRTASMREGGALPADEALGEDETIDVVALLHDGSDAPLLLPIEPTRDRRLLDAIARLMRFAVERGERIPGAAIRYGSEYERTLAFERRLPAWAYDGIDARLPPALRPLQRP